MSKDKSKIEVQTIGKRGKDGQKKLMIILAVVVVVAIAVNVLMASGADDKLVRTDDRPSAVPMAPEGLEEESFESNTQTSIKSLRDSDKRLNAGITENREAMNKLDQDQQEFRKDMTDALGEISEQLKNLKREQQKQEVQEKRDSEKSDSMPPPDRPQAKIPKVPPPPTFGGSSKRPPSSSAGGSSAPRETNKASTDGPMVLTPPRDKEDDGKVKVSVERQENPYAGWLSAGFLPVTTLTGVQAGTASTSQQNPSPMLMRVQGDATLPGAAEYELRGCFITGTSYGDARTHRALTDVATISCVDKKDRLVLEETITGYVVDSDGIEGLRGTLKEKRGAILAKATLASMLEGLGQAFGDAQGTAFDSVTGGGTVISGGDALKSSGLNAASDGAKTLSDFYLQELERLFPVIEVPPNRKATVIITKGKSLKWNDSGSLFTKKTKPQ